METRVLVNQYNSLHYITLKKYPLIIEVSVYNEDKNYLCWQSQKAAEEFYNVKDIYKELSKEYGRCMGNCFIDDNDGNTKAVGWVFEKKVKYDDCNEYFKQVTWIHLYKVENCNCCNKAKLVSITPKEFNRIVKEN